MREVLPNPTDVLYDSGSGLQRTPLLRHTRFSSRDTISGCPLWFSAVGPVAVCTDRRHADVDGFTGGSDMATRALIVHTYPDGSKTHCEIQIKADYPDALAEAVARVRDLWRETCAADEAEAE